jgi:hypothetical protein
MKLDEVEEPVPSTAANASMVMPIITTVEPSVKNAISHLIKTFIN